MPVITKKLIYFNLSDKPENMGISQCPENLEEWLASDPINTILKDAKVSKNILTFTKPDGTEGFATVSDVPLNFQN